MMMFSNPLGKDWTNNLHFEKLVFQGMAPITRDELLLALSTCTSRTLQKLCKYQDVGVMVRSTNAKGQSIVKLATIQQLAIGLCNHMMSAQGSSLASSSSSASASAAAPQMCSVRCQTDPVRVEESEEEEEAASENHNDDDGDDNADDDNNNNTTATRTRKTTTATTTTATEQQNNIHSTCCFIALLFV
jgi:hypothetical protein